MNVIAESAKGNLKRSSGWKSGLAIHCSAPSAATSTWVPGELTIRLEPRGFPAGGHLEPAEIHIENTSAPKCRSCTCQRPALTDWSRLSPAPGAAAANRTAHGPIGCDAANVYYGLLYANSWRRPANHKPRPSSLLRTVSVLLRSERPEYGHRLSHRSYLPTYRYLPVLEQSAWLTIRYH